jgi:hypothetical protein
LRIVKSVALLLLLAFLASTLTADVRQGNVREKGTCAMPPFDCLYTQSGWHKLEYGWYVGGGGPQWSDGLFSDYHVQPIFVCCDSVVKWVAAGGGFAYYEDTQVPETISVEFYVHNADIFFRAQSGCCSPIGEDDLVARYTIPTEGIWPAQWSDVGYCRAGPGFIDYYDDFEKLGFPLDPPLELDADCNYLMTVYSNGDSTVRWWGTIDMMCGSDHFKVTQDAGASFLAGWYWYGGETAGNFDFELRGDILDCYCLCDVCAEAGWDILYDQVSKHTFSNENVYAGLAYGGGEVTSIFGQAFNYQWDGCVKCIGVGGVWGGFNGEYDIPEHLIVELWCMAGQVGDFCEPITLLRRWMVPVAELYETVDPDGYPLYNFFTEDYPGPYTFCDSTAPGGCVWATDDRPFLFVCYSDGADNAPFLWFTDMCKGYCRFSTSDDCEFTWGHNFYWGDPEAGEPEANFSFILCGGCNEVWGPVAGDEVVDSGYIAGPLFGQPQAGYPGWVWFSIPIDPADCCEADNCYDPNTLLGFDAGGKLFYWDKYGKFQQVYRPPFTVWDLEVGNSYLLYMDTTIPNPVYGGVNPYVSARLAGFDLEPMGQWSVPPVLRRQDYDFEVLLGKMGWTWVGMPGMRPIYGGGSDSDFGNKVKVMYPAVPDWQGGTGVVRTAAADYAATPNNWVQWGWSYYDTFLQAPKTFTFYAPFGNKHCFPWIGYRLWVNVGTADAEVSCYYDDVNLTAVFENEDQVMLIWPAPECFYDDVNP